MIKKTVFGTCLFSYVEEYENEENAIKGERGTFIETNISNLKIERTKIVKEDSNESKNSFAKAERLAAKET
jgi:hypothetical protein